MTDRKTDVDVSQLLHQLEELKKKKAKNVKKLKRKLGRAILLKEPESVAAVSANSESNNIEQKTLLLKLQIPENINIVNELNCKISNLSKFKLAEECKNFPKENEKFYNTEAEACSNLQLNYSNQEYHLKSQLSSEKVSKKGILSEIEVTSNSEAKTLDIAKSPKKAENYVHEEDFCCSRKRPSSDAEKEDIFGSQSSLKKVKLFSGELIHKNEKIHSTHIFNSNNVKIGEEIDSKIVRQIVPNFIKNINQETHVKLQKKRNKVIINNSNIQKNDTLLNEVDNLSHFSKITEEETSVKNLSSNFQTNSLKDDYIPPISMQSIATLNKEKKTVLDSSHLVIDVSESSFGMCIQKETTCKITTEAEVDPNVTEVADTEIGFDKEPQVKVLSIKESFLDLNSKISDGIDSLKLPLQEMCLTSSADKCEDICFVNIESNVASFEEIRTEISQNEVRESALHIQDNKDSICCDFTDDDESNYSKCFDSNELEALCQSDYEKYPENFDCESQQDSSSNEDNSCSIVTSKRLVSQFKNKQLKSIPNSDCIVSDSAVLVVPETELFDFARYNETEVDDIGHNVCVIDTVNKEVCYNESEVDDIGHNVCVIDTVNKEVCYNESEVDDIGHNVCLIDTDNEEEPQVYSEFNEVYDHNVDTDSLGTEDFLKLVNCHQILLKSDSSKEINLSDEQSAYMNFQCCLRSDIKEAVTRLKLAYFNNSYYLFIQHITCIQVWRQEKDHDWIKIFAHQVESFQLQELCLSQSENYLVLVMLLNSEENSYSLHFLVFERESKLIKLMEHAYWIENKCEEDESILLCGLDGLKFASAQVSHTFKVYSHTFSCLDGDPRILTVVLGSSNDCLHSLCRIDKLPNALLGMSNNMLYVWHLLEARLVTSVCLQVDSFDIGSCIWTILENGLIFLMVACKGKENSGACQLLAVNLATGFCEVVLTYTLQPALQMRLPSDRKMIIYSEPLIGLACEKGAFIWSVKEEYCCAFLNDLNYTSIAVAPTFSDSFLIIVGCNEGCVNCYELKSKQ